MRANAKQITCLFAFGLALLLARAAGAEPAGKPRMNPEGRLKVAESKTIWKSDGKKLGARLARFSSDGDKLAWLVNGEEAGGGLMVMKIATGETTTLWKAPTGGSVEYLRWGPTNDLAACVRMTEGEKVGRFMVLSKNGSKAAKELPGTDGAHRLAWRSDGRALAFSTRTSLCVYDLKEAKGAILLKIPADKVPPKGPAFEDIVFYKNAVAARRVGTMRYVLKFPEGKELDLGGCRGLAPDPERKRLYLVPWLVGPVKIPRGAGIAWLDPEAEKPERKVIVPDRPVKEGGKPYWLVDVWDWHYPSTLRVSRDGKTLTFAGVKAGVLSENPWREFCIWRVPADGSKAPEVLCEAGSIPKRFDVGDTHCVGWRYAPENACIFFDLSRGKAWRTPKGFYVQRGNTDALPEKLVIAAARGKDLVLFKLEEEKQ